MSEQTPGDRAHEEAERRYRACLAASNPNGVRGRGGPPHDGDHACTAGTRMGRGVCRSGAPYGHLREHPPIVALCWPTPEVGGAGVRERSEEHTSELQSLMRNSY